MQYKIFLQYYVLSFKSYKKNRSHFVSLRKLLFKLVISGTLYSRKEPFRVILSFYYFSIPLNVQFPRYVIKIRLCTVTWVNAEWLGMYGRIVRWTIYTMYFTLWNKRIFTLLFTLSKLDYYRFILIMLCIAKTYPVLSMCVSKSKVECLLFLKGFSNIPFLIFIIPNF